MTMLEDDNHIFSGPNNNPTRTQNHAIAVHRPTYFSCYIEPKPRGSFMLPRRQEQGILWYTKRMNSYFPNQRKI